MSDSIREIIIQDFLDKLAEITVANGYNLGMGANVLRVRRKVDPDILPAVIIWPGREKAEHKYGELACTMTMRIEGIADFGTNNPSAISEQILGDLKKCILDTGWFRSPDYIDGIIYTEGGTDECPDEGQQTVGAAAVFDVKYTTKINDPYTQ
jgi:hypothetical protein